MSSSLPALSQFQSAAHESVGASESSDGTDDIRRHSLPLLSPPRLPSDGGSLCSWQPRRTATGSGRALEKAVEGPAGDGIEASRQLKLSASGGPCLSNLPRSCATGTARAAAHCTEGEQGLSLLLNVQKSALPISIDASHDKLYVWLKTMKIGPLEGPVNPTAPHGS
ncbi:hypothetical protein cyc_02467 [Cyclospora cayetanensis]|uniref:Uncharacterized protein n=1 Tax=Cyclospora cayetanensis TaxID=88456 RepID=A0A1D3D0I5_9EIME|nr:hypothetical protein cyc_02467 [Cyclospora cayetanensis]